MESQENFCLNSIQTLIDLRSIDENFSILDLHIK